MTAAWLQKLNPAQREAVTYGDGPLLIVAGAGTGKTMTLACRVAYLLERGVPADRVLLLTFTRRAAAEMIARAAHMAGGATARRVWGGTFHAIANRLLRIYGEAVGLSREFTVLDQSDAADMMNLVRSELGLAKGRRRFPRKETLVAIYSRCVAAREKLASVLETRFPWCLKDLDGIKALFEQYVDRKRSRNVLDYDDLLLFWHALCTGGAAGTALNARFEHILVDEYQDTNAIQSDILAGMRSRITNICVVGDDAQSVYSFRAATVRNILDFPKRFPGATIVKLEENYRSTQPILAASNAVMAEARERYAKQLWSARESDRRPVLLYCQDEAAQCTVTCDNVLGHLEAGTPLMKQAVLFRAGHHSAHLEIELARRNVPFHKYGGLKFIETSHIKDMLAFLRILENPRDEISWFRILPMLEGIGPRTARRIMDALFGHDGRTDGADGNTSVGLPRSPLQRLIERPPEVPVPARKQFDLLREMFAQCQSVSGRSAETDQASAGPSKAVPSVAVQVSRARRFYEPLFERRYDNAAVRLRDIEQLEKIAAGYRSRSRFLADVTLDPPTSTSDLAQPPYLDDDYLILSTMHSAKGCEWDVVHVIHAADGMIPSDMAVSDDEGVEEERRLFYVAMTRARDTLYVYFPVRYYHRRSGLSDHHNYAQISRFLSPGVRSRFDERASQVEGIDEPISLAPDAGAVDRSLRDLWSD